MASCSDVLRLHCGWPVPHEQVKAGPQLLAATCSLEIISLPLLSICFLSSLKKKCINFILMPPKLVDTFSKLKIRVTSPLIPQLTLLLFPGAIIMIHFCASPSKLFLGTSNCRKKSGLALCSTTQATCYITIRALIGTLSRTRAH